MRTLIQTVFIAALSLSLFFPGICFAQSDTLTAEISQKEFNKISINIQKSISAYQPQSTEELLEIDVSYQPSLPARLDPAVFETAEARRYALGICTADIFYTALFDKKEEMAVYVLTAKKLIDTSGIRNHFDLDKLNEKDLAMLDDPKSMTEEDIGLILSRVDDMTKKIFMKLSNAPKGIDPIVDVSFATAVESLYLISQLVLQSDGGAQALAALANEQGTIEYLMQLMTAVESNAYLKTICELDEKRLVLDPILALYKKKSGNLTKEDGKAILSIIAPVRQKMVTGTLKGYDPDANGD